MDQTAPQNKVGNISSGINANPDKGTHPRYPELDGLRGLASLTVFFSHFVLGTVITSPIFLALCNSPFHLFWDGGSAVSFFFILSGFVLSAPYMNKERPLPLLGFYFKRLFRIYPAFLISILICLVLKAWFYHPGGLGHYSPWLSNIWNWDIKDNIHEILQTFTLIGTSKAGLIDAVIWSLAIEMNISLLVPFLVFIVNKNDYIFNLLFIAVLLYVGVNFYVFLFYAGILLAKYKPAIGTYLSKTSGLLKACLFIAAVLLYTSAFNFKLDVNHHLHDYLSAFGSCLFILLALYSRGFSKFLKNKVCHFLGKVSYSFYLMHLPVFITVASILPYNGSYGKAAVFIFSLFCTCAISFTMYGLVEIPFQKMARKMVSKYGIFNGIKFT